MADPTVYATQQDLTDMGANERQLSGIAPEARDSALAGASAQIDSYLSRVFNLPLLSYGKELSRACAVMAAWDLLSVRGFNAGTDQGQLLKDRYDDVLRWLEKISEGKVKPGWPATVSQTGFNPTKPAFVLAPSQGGIGIEGGSFRSRSDDPHVRVGTPGKPRQRGW